MDLPVNPPVAPMLATPVTALPPQDSSLCYEPKWDGFRCIVFRDGDEVHLGSRQERPFTRYFPELVAAVQDELPPRCVVDGEIVIISGQRLDFDALQQRIHPAASRVRLLAARTPASFVAFDLLALGSESLMGEPFAVRRARLEEILVGPSDGSRRVRLSPITEDQRLAAEWFATFEGAGLDGVVVKPKDLPYVPGKRVMLKVKHQRTADCVVAGYREHRSGPVVGSLLLGLYDEQGRLHHVGVAAAFPMRQRAELVARLAPYRMDDPRERAEHPWAEAATAGAAATGAATAGSAASGGQRLPGAVSRWSAGKDLSFIPLRPELVAEVAYDHMEGDRFRHTAQFRRWRPDRSPRSCTYGQLDRPVAFEVDDVLGR